MKFYIKDEEGNESEIESLYLDVKEEDTILFKVPFEKSLDTKIRTKEILQELFPNNKVAVLDNYVDVGVIRDAEREN